MAPAATPARTVALAVLRRVFEQGAWADRALHGEARRTGLDGRERALAMRLSYGAVQRRATLDHLAEVFAGRSCEQLEPLVVAALRLGLYQLAYLDRVPAHAAVGESVALVKPHSPGGARLVNAVLRRGSREARARVAACPSARRPRPRCATPIRSGSPTCGSPRSDPRRPAR
jgi:16S rRNA (cytosine967-C5)-methyltransferase